MPIQKKLKAWQIIVIVVASIMAVFMLIFIVDDFVYSRSEVRYYRTEFARSELAFFNQRSEFAASHGTFKSIDTVINDFFGERIYDPEVKEIIRFDYDKNTLVFLSSYMEGSFLRPVIPILHILLFYEQANDEVIIRHIWFQEKESIIYEKRRKLFDEDRVARDIVYSYIHREVTALANGDVSMYYGVGLGNPPAYLSILGYEPDNIIAFEYIGEDYFFWYYLSAPEFGEVLSDNIDISTSFMLAEVIELFDIQVIR